MINILNFAVAKLKMFIFGKSRDEIYRLLIRGAEDEIRTRDVHLGKVTLYH